MRQCFSHTMRWMSPDRSPDGWPLQGYDASQLPSRTRGWNHMEKLTPLKPVPPCLKVPQVSGLILPFMSRWGGAEWGLGGWQSCMDHCIPGIAESSLIVSSMLLSVSLHPSSLWSQTVLPLRSGRRRDRWACMQTDRAVLYIRAPLSFHAMSQQVLP